MNTNNTEKNMVAVIETLTKYGFPTNTTGIVGILREWTDPTIKVEVRDDRDKLLRESLNDASVNLVIDEMTGSMANPFRDLPHENKIYLCYLAVDFVRKLINQEQDYDPRALVIKSQKNTDHFFKRMEAGDFGNDYRKVQVTAASEQNPVVVAATVAATGEFKKGNKLVLAREIWNRFVGEKKAVMAAFMDELKMSKAGATTYFYNFRNGTWKAVEEAK